MPEYDDEGPEMSQWQIRDVKVTRFVEMEIAGGRTLGSHFPQCRVFIGRQGMGSLGRERRSGRLRSRTGGLVDPVPETHDIFEQVWLEPTPDHAPGDVIVHISSSGNEALITGD
jgi:glyoxylase-like metal-dependent hydrolase (beta-lactamase superfamily II)